MPFFQGGEGEAGGGGGGHGEVGEGEFHFAGRNQLGGDGDPADAQPGEDDDECRYGEEPEGWALVERGSVVDFGVEPRVDPEDCEGCPAAPSVGTFEGIV